MNNIRKTHLTRILAALALLALSAESAFGQSGSTSWTGNTSTDFYDGSNWANGQYPNGNTTFVDSALTGAANTTVDRASPNYNYIFGLYFNNTLGTQNSYTINGPQGFAIGGSVIRTAEVTSGSLTDVINADIADTGTADVWDIRANHHLNMNGVYSGGNTTTKTGGGTLTFGGANTYTGATSVNVGTLNVTNSSNTPSYTIASGAIVNLSGTDPTAANTDFFGGGTLNIVDTVWFNATGGDFHMDSGGYIDVKSGAGLNFNGGGDEWTGNLADLNIDGSVRGAGNSIEIDSLTGAGTFNMSGGIIRLGQDNGTGATFSGNFGRSYGDGSTTGTANRIEKNGTGTQTLTGNLVNLGAAGTVTVNDGTLTLSGTNTYGGGTTVNDGFLRITGGTGSLPGSAVVNDPGALQLVGNDHNWSNTITGDGTVQLEFSNGNGNTQLNGIGGFAGTVNLMRTSGTGGDKWWVNGVNAPSTDVIINSATQLFVTSAATTFDSISVSGTGNTESRGAIRLSSGTLNGDISLLGNTTIGASSSGIITGAIAPTIVGTTTLTLGAPNEHSFGFDALRGVLGDGAGTLAVEVYNTNDWGAGIAGARNNTYSGGTTLLNSSNGTRLILSSVTGTPYGTGAITIGQAATDKAGIYFQNSNQTLSNNLVFNTALGTDRPGIRADGTNNTLSGDITANLSDATFSTNGTGAFALTGKVTGSNGITLHNTYGSSITVTLNNAAENNDYAGDSTIAGTKGTLALGRANQIPNGATAGDVVNNGRLNLNGYSDTINGLSGSGTVDGVSGTPTLTVGDNDTTSSFNGTITDAAGALGLTKSGSGTLTLRANNTYSGKTNINAGVLELQSTSGFFSYNGGDLNINNGSTLRFSNSGGNGYVLDAADTINFDSNGGGLFDRVSGNFVVRGSTITTAGGSANTIQGSFNMDSGDVIFDVAPGDDAVDLIVSAVLGNSQGIVKQGAGTMSLTATNTYTGTTTVTAGTLAVTGSTNSGAVNVSNGATLAGDGTIGGTVTISSGGVLSPGL